MGIFIGIQLDLKVKVNKKGIFRKKNIKFENLKEFLSSAYHSAHKKKLKLVTINSYL